MVCVLVLLMLVMVICVVLFVVLVMCNVDVLFVLLVSMVLKCSVLFWLM